MDYRSPGTPGPRGDLIYRWLRTRHRLGVSGALLGILGGALAVIATAWLVSALTSLIFFRFGAGSDREVIQWSIFGGYLLLIVPILLWRTARTGGEFFADQVLESRAFHGQPASHGEWRYRAGVATTALYGDLLFWGPRLIVDGVRRLIGREVVRSASTLHRASFILSHLLRGRDASRTKALRIPDEPPTELQHVLRWLDRHDYVGISADGQRVWLASAARESLSLMLQIDPGPKTVRRGRAGKGSNVMDNLKTVDMISAR